MKIIFGGGVSAMRGSLQGTTFSINKNGAYAKKKPTPTNRNSSTQLEQRLLFAQVNKMWGQITNGDRQAWANVVTGYPYTDVNGVVQTYTAKQLFVRVNLTLLSAGEEPVLTPIYPNWGSFGNLSSLTFSTSGSAVFNFSGLYFNDGVDTDELLNEAFISIYATAQVSEGTTAPKEAMFRKIISMGGAITMVDISILNAYRAVFGDPVTGKSFYVAAKYGYKSTGYLSTLQFVTKKTP